VSKRYFGSADVMVNDVTGALLVETAASGTAEPAPVASVTSVAASMTPVTLMSASASRRGGVIHNDSSNVLYVKLGPGASDAEFTYRLPSQATLELPTDPLYLELISGAWNGTDGNARVTELT
jgi:hypothetical protein